MRAPGTREQLQHAARQDTHISGCDAQNMHLDREAQMTRHSDGQTLLEGRLERLAVDGQTLLVACSSVCSSTAAAISVGPIGSK